MIRQWHDHYSSLCGLIGKKTVRRTHVPPHHLVARWTVQEAGELHFDNRFERSLYPDRDAELPHRWPTADAFHLRSVRVVGRDGYVFFNDGSILAVDPLVTRIRKERTIRRPISIGAGKLVGKVIHLCGANADNHGHFILDFLPRVMALKPLWTDDATIRFLLSPGQLRWQARYLERMGISRDRLIEGNGGTLWVEELILAPNLHSHDLVDKFCGPDTLRALGDLFRSRLPASSPGEDVILASRLEAPNKKILNEAELAEEAGNIFGAVRIIELSRLSLEEQLTAFAGAHVIIGAVGQNMANLMVSRGARVLIMTLEDKLWPGKRSWGRGYHNLALLNNNPAITVLRETEPDDDSNWIVPPATFRKAATYIARQLGKTVR